MFEKIKASIFRILTTVIIIIFLVLNFCFIYDYFVGDGSLPKIRSIKLENSIKIKDFSSCPIEFRKKLSELSPEIGDWYDKLYREGKLKFNSDYNENKIAVHDCLTGNVTLFRSFLEENSASQLITFVHEYRHSRQNYGRVFVTAFFRTFTSWETHDIIERQAEEYEDLALRNIRW